MQSAAKSGPMMSVKLRSKCAWSSELRRSVSSEGEPAAPLLEQQRGTAPPFALFPLPSPLSLSPEPASLLPSQSSPSSALTTQSLATPRPQLQDSRQLPFLWPGMTRLFRAVLTTLAVMLALAACTDAAEKAGTRRRHHTHLAHDLVSRDEAHLLHKRSFSGQA